MKIQVMTTHKVVLAPEEMKTLINAWDILNAFTEQTANELNTLGIVNDLDFFIHEQIPDGFYYMETDTISEKESQLC